MLLRSKDGASNPCHSSVGGCSFICHERAPLLILYCHCKGEPTDCCTTSGRHLDHPPAAQLSCFTLLENPDTGRCINPVPLLTQDPGLKGTRCSVASDCHAANYGETDMECVRPDENSRLLRIAVVPPAWEETNGATKIVLWNGPLEEIYEQGNRVETNRLDSHADSVSVVVGRFAPRSRYLSPWIPEVTALFFEYV